MLRVAIGAYVLANLLGALVFGTRWFARGDAFEVWSRLYGRSARSAGAPTGRWVLRTPLHGANAMPAAARACWPRSR